MRLLDRYLFRELCTPLLYSLAGFFIFWVGADMFREQAFLQPLKLAEIAGYYLVTAPAQLVEILPITLLLGLLYALSNHARNFEITAIRAAGVSIWRLALPYFLVGFAATLIAFVLNEYWVIPDRDARLDLVKRWRAQASPKEAKRGLVELNFSNDIQGRKWHADVYDPKTAQMLKVEVIGSVAGQTEYWLRASNAVYTSPGWTFYNAIEYRPRSETNRIPTPVLKTNVMARPDFTETPEEIRSELKIAARLNLGGGREADLPLREILDYLRFHPELKPEDQKWLFTYLHGRLATPFRCLVVVLIALPFGAASGRRNVFVGVASSIFIAFAYFILARVSIMLGTGGHLAPWLAGWAPNLLFGGVGLFLTFRLR